MFVELLVIFCFFAVFYAYFGYPLILLVLSRITGTKAVNDTSTATETLVLPRIAIIITVRNEAQVIRMKLENTLELRYGEQSVREWLNQENSPLELLVASDASDDETDSVVREYESAGVSLVRLEQRGGKERAQKAAIEEVSAEIVVFTDAKIRLNSEALDSFAAHFGDPNVGAVSSIDRVEQDEDGGAGEGFYVRYEMWLRSLESKFSTLIGLSGSCFAVRKEVSSNLSVDIPSDFALLIEARKQGLRGLHAEDVIGTYKTVKTEKEEFNRKVRTVLRGISTLLRRKELFNPFQFGLFSWQIISHKLCRWLVPWFFILGVCGSFALAQGSLFFALLAFLSVCFFVLAVCGCFIPKCRTMIVCKIPLFFLITNAAVAVAWMKYLTGSRTVQWDPSAKAS